MSISGHKANAVTAGKEVHVIEVLKKHMRHAQIGLHDAHRSSIDSS
jgi:hypothetical protein